MLGIGVSTIVFFVVAYTFKRYLEEMDIPKGMTRGTLIFTVAVFVSYLAALLVDYLSKLA